MYIMPQWELPPVSNFAAIHQLYIRLLVHHFTASLSCIFFGPHNTTLLGTSVCTGSDCSDTFPAGEQRPTRSAEPSAWTIKFANHIDSRLPILLDDEGLSLQAIV